MLEYMNEEYLDSEMFGYYNILARWNIENEWKARILTK